MIRVILTIILVCCFSGPSEAEVKRVYEKWVSEFEGEIRELSLYKDGSCEEKVTFESEMFFNVCRYKIIDNQLTIIYGNNKLPSSKEWKMKFTILHDRLYLFGNEIFKKEKTNKFKNENAASGSDASATRPF